ncbi:hypothetical protein ACER0C_001416 [Sarotherodon galilaeus]
MICRILLLIILTSCVSGSFVVNVTQTCYQAEENHNITLEWTFTTKPDRSTKTLNILCELFISNNNVSVLYHVHEGVEVSESQDEKFSGRVQSDKDALREGRIRLQLSRLRTDDSGLYLCEVNTDYGFSVGRCRLNVTGEMSETLKHEVRSSQRRLAAAKTKQSSLKGTANHIGHICHMREKMICRILLLIILTSCVSGSFVVNVTQTSYQAEENHNITLE